MHFEEFKVPSENSHIDNLIFERIKGLNFRLHFFRRAG